MVIRVRRLASFDYKDESCILHRTEYMLFEQYGRSDWLVWKTKISDPNITLDVLSRLRSSFSLNLCSSSLFNMRSFIFAQKETVLSLSRTLGVKFSCWFVRTRMKHNETYILSQIVQFDGQTNAATISYILICVFFTICSWRWKHGRNHDGGIPISM